MGSETQVEVKESESLGLLTKYLRTIQYAQLQQDFEWPSDLYEVTAPDVPDSEDGASPSSKRDGLKNKRRGSVQSTGAGAGGLLKGERKKNSFTELHNAQDDLTSEPILLWEKGDKVMLYSWLSLSTFTYLRSENGKSLLERWVKNIDVKQALIEAHQEQEADESKVLREDTFVGMITNGDGDGSGSEDGTSDTRVSHI